MKKRVSAFLLACSILLCLPACGGISDTAADPPAGTPSVSSLRRYAISFDPNGGELVSGSLDQHVAGGAVPEAPELTRFGYELDGWDPELTAATKNTAYTARWSAVSFTPEELYAYIAPSVGEIVVFDEHGDEYALGSGFFIDDEGTMITNFHVMEGAYSAEVTTSDGATHSVESVLGYDTAIDLAMLHVDITDNSFLLLSDEPVLTGETVYAIGSSLGLTSTFSDGIVSTASRDYDGVRYIQTTAPISHGNSGGPLVDTHGWVVGINTMSMAEGQNLNFALDVREIDNLDISHPLTVNEFYDETASHYTADQVGAFYDETDYAEIESNDSLMLADMIPYDEWVAGEVTDGADLDYFAIEIDEPGTYLFEAVPLYKSDSEYLLGGVFQLTEDNFELIDILAPSESLNYEIENALELTLDEADVYFLVLMADDDYSYSEPIYYKLRVS